MTRTALFCRVMGIGVVLLTGANLWSADGVISSVPDASGTYCALRFPAIREDTLYWDRPVLKHPESGDIISYYGPCNHDPLGKLEITRQRDQLQIRRRHLPEGE